MDQEEKSERSRAQILEAALELFSRQGYRGTSIRDISKAASVSTGSVYHHFRDKEELFDTLLSQYWAAIESPDFPFNRALASGAFPDRLEELAEAAEASVRAWERHVALIYVDVVEMQGTHIQRFYSGMAERFAAFLRRYHAQDDFEARLTPDVSPLSAVMLASRIFLQYYAVERLFHVPDQFGKPSKEAIRDISEILRRGMLRERRPAR
ncbi:MAG TPA: helix-turn-helix domain-containing protein [Thermoanaerobaculia bacterium]|nr:helix-turn-helix domain-containing protein [Thermoanaerobaculia bacterium]